MKSRSLRTSLPAATAAAVLLFGAQLGAQTPTPTSPPRNPNEPEKGEEVLTMEQFVSTGTRFSDRTVLDSVVPIDVLTPKELRAGGYSDTPSILATLVPSFNFPPLNTAGSGSFNRRASIRGLSYNQVLVLVNGKRHHLGVQASGAGADFNSFPPTSIGRVEVLRDGAAAQYGSDAIAGVLNVFLRRDLGTEVGVTVGQTYKSDGEVYEVSIDHGIKLADTGFLHTSLYFRRSGLTNRQGADVRQQYFGFRNGAQIVFPVVSSLDSSPVLQPGDTLDPRESTIDRHKTYRQGDSLRHEYGLFLNSEVPIFKRFQLYTFGGYMLRNVQTPFVWRRPLDSNNVRAIFPDGFQPIMEGVVTDASFNAGVKGRVGEWSFDLSEGWGLNKLAPYPHNTLNPSMGTSSPTDFYAGGTTAQMAVTNLDLKRSFQVPFLPEHLDVAVGSEYKWDGMVERQGSVAGYIHGGVTVLDGPSKGATTAGGSQGYGGVRPEDEQDVSRTNYAFYADLETRLFERLTVSTAGRYEDYSGVGDTLDGKLALRLKLTDVFSLRASASTGFRAPTLSEIYYTSTSSNFISGVSYLIRRFPVNSPVAKLLGAKPLVPETSVGYSAGVTAQFTPHLNATLDLYQITVKDQLVSSSTFNDVATRNFLATQGFTNISGASFGTNALDARVQGMDLTGRYDFRLFETGQVVFTTAINFNNRKALRIAPTPPELAAITTIPLYDRANVLTYSRGQPRRTFNFGVNYIVGKWDFGVREIRYGSFFAGQTNPAFDQTFSAKWLTDVTITRRFGKSFSLSAGVNNLFDVYPDKRTQINNPDGTNVYTSSSPFGYNGGYYFTRAMLKF